MTDALYKKGNFILVANIDLQSRIISFGTRSKWCHAALIVDEQGSIVEATSAGVNRANIHKYDHLETKMVDVGLNDEDRQRVVDYALSQIGDKYDWSDILSIALTVATGSKISFASNGRFICSGLIGESEERGGISFDKEGRFLYPGDLDKRFP